MLRCSQQGQQPYAARKITACIRLRLPVAHVLVCTTPFERWIAPCMGEGIESRTSYLLTQVFASMRPKVAVVDQQLNSAAHNTTVVHPTLPVIFRACWPRSRKRGRCTYLADSDSRRELRAPAVVCTQRVGIGSRRLIRRKKSLGD